jgi:hypothetical protein
LASIAKCGIFNYLERINMSDTRTTRFPSATNDECFSSIEYKNKMLIRLGFDMKRHIEIINHGEFDQYLQAKTPPPPISIPRHLTDKMERVTAEPPKRTIWQRIFGIRTDYS